MLEAPPRGEELDGATSCSQLLPKLNRAPELLAAWDTDLTASTTLLEDFFPADMEPAF